ncbi:hypothetical protein [Streptomyces sp. BK208]|uniref:cupin domain-containing protein n=1 Tax=Streptomyces sp. BK208 TaxID=2512150 RepID=UPI001FBA1E62|nr:hypothetical protein [Streptomyces sp. BK208]
MADSNSSRLSGVEPFEAAASSLFAPLRVTDADPPAFRAVVGHTDIGPVTVARIQATPATVIRDRRTISSSDHELMHLTLLHRGTVAVKQDGRTAALEPGELFACDNTRPYRIIGAAPTDMTVLCVPRANLGRHADSIGRRTALPLSAQDGINRLLTRTLSTADEDLPGRRTCAHLPGRRAHRSATRRLRRHHPRARPRRQRPHRPNPRLCTGPPWRSPAQRRTRGTPAPHLRTPPPHAVPGR